MGDAYLGLGLTDVIITRLSQITEIDVRPTSSVLRYADREVDPAEAARELAVDSVLLGRVTKSGERIRVTVQLINVAASSLLWADKLDLSSTDIFTYEDVIAEHVARTLRLQLSGQQFVRLTKRHTENSEAYQSYLRGRYYLSKRTPENFQKAIQSFEEATNADPNYALAYSGLSECYTLLNYYGVISPEIGGARAKSAAERALEADDALAEAHTAAALVAFWYDWDWIRTQMEFERAIRLNPAYTPAHQWYGCYLVATRQFDRSASIGARALEIDPLVPTVNMALGKICFFSRRYDEAIKHCLRALSLEPDFVPALHFLGQAYLQKGMFEEALAGYEKAMKVLGRLPIGAAIIACTRALAGDKTGAEEALSRLQELADSGETYVPAFAFALIHTGLGNREKALDWLEKAYQERFIWMVYLNVDPVFDSLRDEPRFRQLIKRLRFPATKQERWQRLDELFHAAIEQDPEAREDFVAEACRDDAELRHELESMLAHHDAAGDFIESPAYALAAEAVLSDESSEALVGRVVGPYQILEVLGSGGMGVVYVAFDQDLRRKVALKFLHHDLTGDKSKVLRFRQEARAASALNHPNILTVFAIGELEGRHYIGTELVEGETLREVIRRGPMKLGELLHIAVQTCSALAAAHAAGIMHRDIKPENIVVRPDGYVKVLDFGLAKLIEPSATGAELSTLINTEQGTIIGTVHYMSPEQARGLTVDPRTDIWSLGIVLYEMITGCRAFEGTTRSDVIVSILEHEPPLLADHDGGAIDELQRIVTRTLAKDLNKRYQEATELEADLRHLNQRLEVTATLDLSVLPRAQSASRSTTLPTAANVIRPTSSAEYLVSGIKQHKIAAIAVLAPLVLILVLSIYFLSRSKESKSVNSLAGQPINSVAIMPFSFASSDPKVLADPDKEYLSDGITESLINNLSHLPDLKVIASASVFRYKGQQTDPQKVAQELSVQAIVTGRIMQRGDALSIRVALVDARDGRHLWGEQYERKLSELAAAQSDLARQIAQHLRPALTSDRQNELTKRYTENSEAYQLYLKGRYFLNKRTQDGFNKAIEYFNQSIDLDPNYAQAYAGLADAYSLLADYRFVPPQEAVPKARAAATKALQMDDTLAEAHTSLAFILGNYDWDWAGAEKEIRRAIELNPNYALAHHWYATMYLSLMRRHQEALAEISRARELDPLSIIINADLGLVLYNARQYDQAIEQYRKTVEMDPNFVRVHDYLQFAYEMKGMYEAAIGEIQQARTLATGNAELAARFAEELRKGYAASGPKGYWQVLLDRAIERSKLSYISPFYLGVLYSQVGQNDRAFEMLEKAYQEHGSLMSGIQVAPRIDPLRSDPRFKDLVRRMKFPTT